MAPPVDLLVSAEECDFWHFVKDAATQMDGLSPLAQRRHLRVLFRDLGEYRKEREDQHSWPLTVLYLLVGALSDWTREFPHEDPDINALQTLPRNTVVKFQPRRRRDTDR